MSLPYQEAVVNAGQGIVKFPKKYELEAYGCAMFHQKGKLLSVNSRGKAHVRPLGAPRSGQRDLHIPLDDLAWHPDYKPLHPGQEVVKHVVVHEDPLNALSKARVMRTVEVVPAPPVPPELGQAETNGHPAPTPAPVQQWVIYAPLRGLGYAANVRLTVGDFLPVADEARWKRYPTEAEAQRGLRAVRSGDANQDEAWEALAVPLDEALDLATSPSLDRPTLLRRAMAGLLSTWGTALVLYDPAVRGCYVNSNKGFQGVLEASVWEHYDTTAGANKACGHVRNHGHPRALVTTLEAAFDLALEEPAAPAAPAPQPAPVAVPPAPDYGAQIAGLLRRRDEAKAALERAVDEVAATQRAVDEAMKRREAATARMAEATRSLEAASAPLKALAEALGRTTAL